MNKSNIEFVEPSVRLLTTTEELWAGLRRIESMGRICYQSADNNPPENYSQEKTIKFVSMLIGKHHESVLEHANLSFVLTTNRAVTHQLVRHRLCAYSQESQRYCNYSLGKFGNKVQIIKPIWFSQWSDTAKAAYCQSMNLAAATYFQLIQEGCKPEEARGVLPNDCKTQIGVTVNLRELRHILTERCSAAAQPEIRQLFLTIKHALPEFLTADIEEAITTKSDGVIPDAEIILS